MKIVVESHDTQISARSVQAKLKIFINNTVIVQFCAKLGILVVSTTNIIVPRIIGVGIGINVLFKPIDDGKLLSSLNPAPSYIETIARAKNKTFIETSPKQILFLPGDRGTNQITISTLESKYRFMCPPKEGVGLERSSKKEFVPLSERTKTLRDLVGHDSTKIGPDAELILAPQVREKRINISID